MIAATIEIENIGGALAQEVQARSASFMAGMSTLCGQRVTQVWQDVHSQMKRLESTTSRWSSCTMRTNSCGLRPVLAATGQPLEHFAHW